VSENGRYRIQTVAEMTGVSAATLRAWERRYGIPAPRRTAAAYRLYTDQDIELIKRVRELCDGGIAPSQAAQMVLASRDNREDFAQIGTDTHELAIQKILAAVEKFDADLLDAAITHSLFLGAAPTLFERVFAPALQQIGQRWHEGTISIGQEHLATEAIGNALRYILRLSQPEAPEKTAVLGCFADEEHAMPLYGVALRLSDWGFRTVMLGPRTPPHAIRHAVEEVHPDIVGLSLTVVPPTYRVRELIEGYAEACGKTPWVVGGYGAEKVRELVEAHGGILSPTDRLKLKQLIDRLTSAAG
jgi:DNA-binding transcriptional MerR regulator